MLNLNVSRTGCLLLFARYLFLVHPEYTFFRPGAAQPPLPKQKTIRRLPSQPSCRQECTNLTCMLQLVILLWVDICLFNTLLGSLLVLDNVCAPVIGWDFGIRPLGPRGR